MRVVFAGTPAFAVPALAALLAAPTVQLVGVFTQPDRRAGRGKRLRQSAVSEAMAAVNQSAWAGNQSQVAGNQGARAGNQSQVANQSVAVGEQSVPVNEIEAATANQSAWAGNRSQVANQSAWARNQIEAAANQSAWAGNRSQGANQSAWARNQIEAAAVNQSAPVPVFQPHVWGDDATAELKNLRADLLVVVAYGALLPAAALAMPRLGCVNIHASLLPRWRGAAPIQRAIEAGDAITGLSLMRMECGLDAGAVFARRRIAIAPQDTAGSLQDKLARQAGEFLAAHLPALASAALPAVVQDESAACYARKIHTAEARLNWRAEAATVVRQIRAFNPKPMAHATVDGVRLRILRAEVDFAADPARLDKIAPGVIYTADKSGVCVATGGGGLRLIEVQKPGRAAMSAAAWQNGMAVVGSRFDVGGEGGG